MLIFGPYRSIPLDEPFVVYNLSSPVQAIPRLPGLLVTPNPQVFQYNMDDGTFEKEFDMWYYDYVLNDPTACSSLMAVLTSLYNGNHVYVCISDNMSSGLINIVNESFMKMIQSRYGIKYSIINEPEDFIYVDRDGCDFMNVEGITAFDADRRRFDQLTEEDRLMHGGTIPDGY